MSCSQPQPRRVEEASLNAWPALTQMLLDGWLVRMTRGFTKRANSVTPLYPSLEDDAAKIAQCERIYAEANLRTVFRLPSLTRSDALDRLLEDRDYQVVEPTRVLTLPLAGASGIRDPRVRTLERADWLGLYARLTAQPGDANRLHALIVSAIPAPCLFLAAYQNETPAACGLAVLDDDLAGLFDIVTAPDRRRRGLAEAIVGDALARAAERHVGHAYLQVVEDNEPARRLYDRLGFRTLYSYRYRVSRR